MRPHLQVTYRGETFVISKHGEAWCIDVDGGQYFLSTADPDAASGRFIRARLTNSLTPRRPALLASQRYPLVVTVDGVQVRAWPAELPRGKGATTYVNPATGDRVATTRGPMWMFAAKGRPPADCGSATVEQTLADVADLATIWLRSEPA